MNKKSIQIYAGLIILLSIFAALSIYLPQGSFLPVQEELPASKPVLALVNALIMLILYGGLGYIGLRLSSRLGYAEIWSKQNNIKKRIVQPLLIGIGLGLILILLDVILSGYNGFGRLPHPVFPTSIIASYTAGVGEEVLFRLFFIPFWVRVISGKIFKGKYNNIVFWLVTFLSAIVFTISHIPAIMFLTGVESIYGMSQILLFELFLMNGLISLFAAYYLRKSGFLTAAGIHFWTDIVWHVLWGLI